MYSVNWLLLLSCPIIQFLKFYSRQSCSRYNLCSLPAQSKQNLQSLVWAWRLHSLKPALIPDLTLVASVEIHGWEQVNMCFSCPASQSLNPSCQHVMQWVLCLAPLWAHHMWGFLETLVSPRHFSVTAEGWSICCVVFTYVESEELAASSQQTHQTSIKRGLVSEDRMEFPDVTP